MPCLALPSAFARRLRNLLLFCFFPCSGKGIRAGMAHKVLSGPDKFKFLNMRKIEGRDASRQNPTAWRSNGYAQVKFEDVGPAKRTAHARMHVYPVNIVPASDDEWKDH